MLIDTHTHLYLDKFHDDLDEVIYRAEESGVEKMLLPNIDLSTIASVFELEEKYPGKFYPMVGLHPCSVKSGYNKELQELEQFLDKKCVIAIGEIGIDLYWDKSFEQEQIHAFELQIDWALSRNLPIVIHSRNAIRQCIDVVANKQNGKLRGVFHCFDQELQDAKDIIDLDFYLGIGGVITFKKSNLPEVVKEIELDHILLETDSPFLAPSPKRGKRNESSYVRYVAEKIAEIKEVTIEEIESVTSKNANELFGILN